MGLSTNIAALETHELICCYMHHTLADLLGPVQREGGQTPASLRMRKSGTLGMLQLLLSLRPALHSENIEDLILYVKIARLSVTLVYKFSSIFN